MEGATELNHAVLPPEETRYLADVARTLDLILGADLVAVYLLGSGAYGGYVTGPSDLDVAVVIGPRLGDQRRGKLVEALRHDHLPCPARRLELVVYRRQALADLPEGPDFELNLNTGRDIGLYVEHHARREPGHWFVLDLAIARDLARPLVGPSPRHVIAQVSPGRVTSAILGSLAWHLANEPETPNAVLNAARSWQQLATGKWGSKPEGARWIRENHPGWTVVDAALVAHRDGGRLPRDEVAALVTQVQTVAERNAATTR